MAMLRGLSRLLAQPALLSSQLSAGITAGIRSGFGQGQLLQPQLQQQCSSLLGFLQSRLVSSSSSSSSSRRGSEGFKLLGQPGMPPAAAAVAAGLWQHCSSRGLASKLQPRFLGCKLKPYSSYKERFKMTGSRKIRYMRPGAVHKHHNKGNRQNRDLSKTQVLYETYAKTMRKLGFKMRSF